MKAFYHFNNGLICGLCGWQMYPDAEHNRKHSPEMGMFYPAFYCVNEKCKQWKVVVEVPPLSVETNVRMA